MSATSGIDWRTTDEGLVAYVGTRKAVWAPQPGSQEAFLECPIYECLYTGTRGPGKTDALLMDFAQEVGQGWGSDWNGVLFRRTYPELQDVIDKSKKWFPRIWPAAQYNEAKNFWKWPTGEILYFRHFLKEADYWKYHGHSYPWIGWEELTTWPNDWCFKKMFSCSRSTAMGIPIRIRSTTNPYGVGHNWVKTRYRLPIPGNKMVGQVIRNSRDLDGHLEPPRVVIHGDLYENKILLTAQPDYIQNIRASARNQSEIKAWIEGSWDIVAGGMLDDVWDPAVHVVSIPVRAFPKGWKFDRAYDHGQSKPFSVGWYAESNGEPFEWEGKWYGHIKGDTFRIGEWYGSNGRPNEGLRMLSSTIAEGILDREDDMGLKGRVRPGPADSSIFDDFEPNKSVAGDMQKIGVRWEAADKGPGSRKQGWEQLRKALSNAKYKHGTREKPGLFICDSCPHFIRTVPILPRDDKDLDDVNTDSEDHIGDEVRYRVRRKVRQPKQRDM